MLTESSHARGASAAREKTRNINSTIYTLIIYLLTCRQNEHLKYETRRLVIRENDDGSPRNYRSPRTLDLVLFRRYIGRRRYSRTARRAVNASVYILLLLFRLPRDAADLNVKRPSCGADVHCTPADLTRSQE